MTQRVVITLRYPNQQHLDLNLPADVPIQVLANAIARAVNIPEANSNNFLLVVCDGNRRVQLNEGKTLLDAGVMYGDILELVPGVTSSSGKEQKPQAYEAVSAYLVFQSGERFKLNPSITRLGRWAPGNNVDVDLTSFDHSKRVSRHHALIENKHGDYFILDDESMNGTMLNGIQLKKGEQRMLTNGDQILLGGEGGVQTRFVSGKSGELSVRS